MSLLDESRAAVVRRGSECSVARIQTELGEELREALRSDIETAALTRALASRGYRVSSDTLGRHRNGDCKCLPY